MANKMTVTAVDQETGEVLPAVVTAAVQLGTLRATSPAELIAGAEAAATPLARLIEAKALFNNINGRKYVRCEGWTTLAAMLGCMPREVSVTRREDGTYEASVELVRMQDGAKLTRASAECGMDEPTWASRASYARRSMAITRATSKACRIAFSWVMTLAGYEATPAEEMSDGGGASGETVWTLPGDASKWDGHGGKKLADVPPETLAAAKRWLEKKADARNAGLLRALEDELEARRPAATEK